jgi:hypothetical protein
MDFSFYVQEKSAGKIRGGFKSINALGVRGEIAESF